MLYGKNRFTDILQNIEQFWTCNSAIIGNKIVWHHIWLASRGIWVQYSKRLQESCFCWIIHEVIPSSASSLRPRGNTFSLVNRMKMYIPNMFFLHKSDLNTSTLWYLFKFAVLYFLFYSYSKTEVFFFVFLLADNRYQLFLFLQDS